MLKRLWFMLALCLLPGAGTFAADSIPQQGLILWLDAADAASLQRDGDFVTGWHSKVPGSNVKLIASEKARPKFVAAAGTKLRPAVAFDGKKNTLRAMDFKRSAATWTLLMVVAPNLCKDMNALLSGCPVGGNDYDPGFNVDLYQSGEKFDNLNVEGAGRITGQQDLMTSALPYGGYHCIVVVREAEAVKLFIDGKPEGTRPMTKAVTVMDELRLGARFYSASQRHYFNGDIAQVLLYDRALSADELDQLQRRYQVTAEEQKLGEDRRVQQMNAHPEIRMALPKVVKNWPSVEAWQASPDAQVPVDGPCAGLGLPLRTDVREALELSVQHMNSLFDKDKQNEPYFFSNCQLDGTGKMLHSVSIGIPHVVGRCLLGSLIAQDLAGITPSPQGIEILTHYCKQSFDNPDNLNSFFDPQRENKRFVEMHNMREGLYGLVYLYKVQHDEWAKTKADAMIKTLASITDDKGVWSEELATKLGMKERLEGMMIMNAARVVDPLLAWYRLTKNEEALRLAGLYAHQGLITAFDDQGRFTEWTKSSGHIHSITSSLSGITDYAIVKKDASMLAQCEKIMKNGVPDYFSSWGWGDEVMPAHPADVIGRGEINQTGDVIRTALLLAAAVNPDYYDYAERFMRGMILPTQHREPELRRFMHDNPAAKDDTEYNVIRRSIGGFAMQLPNDRMREGDWPISTLDITSGAAHAMSEFIHAMLGTSGDSTTLNLPFSCANSEFEIISSLPLTGRILFTSRGGSVLKIRVPSWVDQKSLKLTVSRDPVELQFDHGYVVIRGLKAGNQGELTFDVPCRMEKETVDGTEYTTKWAGDQILAIEPRGEVSPLPF